MMSEERRGEEKNWRGTKRNNYLGKGGTDYCYFQPIFYNCHSCSLARCSLSGPRRLPHFANAANKELKKEKEKKKKKKKKEKEKIREAI